MKKFNRYFVGTIVGNFLFAIVSFLIVSLVFAACAALKPAILTADDVAAQLLCAQASAEKKGITVDEAKDAYCSTRDTWRPWLEAVLAARRLGAARAAGLPEPMGGPGCPQDAPAASATAPAPTGTKSPPAGSPGAP